MSAAASLWRTISLPERFFSLPSLSSSLHRSSSDLHCLSISNRTLVAMANDSSASGGTLETLNFVNGAAKKLPVDSVEENYVRTVQGIQLVG